MNMFAVLGVIFIAIWLFSAPHAEAPHMIHLLLLAGLLMLFAHFRLNVRGRHVRTQYAPNEQRRSCALLHDGGSKVAELVSSLRKQL